MTSPLNRRRRCWRRLLNPRLACETTSSVSSRRRYLGSILPKPACKPQLFGKSVCSSFERVTYGASQCIGDGALRAKVREEYALPSNDLGGSCRAGDIK
eukprot:192324-Pleurochrysis_carterae.AAC.2